MPGLLLLAAKSGVTLKTDTFGCRFFCFWSKRIVNSVKSLAGVLLLGLVMFGAELQAQNVIEDAGVGMTRQELEQWINYWTPQMKKAAAIDRGDRIELLNMALAAKKIALEADSMSPDADPDAYWKMQFAIRNVQRGYVTQQYMSNLEVPDMAGLAEEQYRTEKDKYAFVPEVRSSSHILIMCKAGACDMMAKKAVAQEVLDKLQAGADFEEMVEQFSEDPGSKNKGGKFDRWMRLGEPEVSPPYVGALFEIDEVGGYSPVTTTQFGFHIIRLDGIQESYYKPFEEVRPRIIATLEHEYKTLAAKEFDARYRLTDAALMDEKALDEIFAPYKPVEPTVESPAAVDSPTDEAEPATGD
jgi:peptidyl-prolyl cis-trans isomerase C